jgi:hypothetical protein
MVNYIEPNLQEIIFGPIRVGLITQKQFWDHLKNCHSWGLRTNAIGIFIEADQQWKQLQAEIHKVNKNSTDSAILLQHLP